VISSGFQEMRTYANELLSDRDQRRVIILGDPGSGKTTLLKAQGLALLGRTRSSSRLKSGQLKRRGEIPIFVILRRFNRSLQSNSETTLLSYIVDEVRRLGARNPREFVDRLALASRLVVMLDGLDEVTDAAYPLLLDSIRQFSTGADGLVSTAQVRIIVTCRACCRNRLLTSL
jgi:predicted NACHT family NTPase